MLYIRSGSLQLTHAWPGHGVLTLTCQVTSAGIALVFSAFFKWGLHSLNAWWCPSYQRTLIPFSPLTLPIPSEQTNRSLLLCRRLDN